jgi:polysaccharide pyruvyl transferase WcaK-like protein
MDAKQEQLQREAREEQDRQTSLAGRIDEIRGLAAPGTSSHTVLLVNDCGDQRSFGTEALMDGLAVILAQSTPDVRFRSVPSHWLVDAPALRVGFPAGGAGLRQPTPVFPAVADQFDEIADEWLAGDAGPGASEYLAKFKGADLVILNGEGSIYRTNLSAIRELFLTWFAKTRLGIPTMFVNGTVHLTDVLPFLPAMVRKTFGVLDAVTVREPFSLRNLAAYAPDVPARVMADTAYALTPDRAASGAVVRAIREQLGGRDYFCYDPGPMTVDNRTPNRSAEYVLISELKEIVPQAILIPSPPLNPHAEQLGRVAEETDSIHAGTLRGYDEYMALVENAQFVVSGRHHDTILAAIMGCPTIAYGSTSHKVHGACELLGLIGTAYDSTDLRSNMAAITRQAREYVADRETLRLGLQSRCAELRAEAHELGTLATSLLNGRAG